jgi:hypothetical protein
LTTQDATIVVKMIGNAVTAFPDPYPIVAVALHIVFEERRVRGSAAGVVDF